MMMESPTLYELKGEEDFKSDGTATEQQAKFIERETEQMITADVDDKDLQRDKILAKKRKQKEAERKLRELEENDGTDSPVILINQSSVASNHNPKVIMKD